MGVTDEDSFACTLGFARIQPQSKLRQVYTTDVEFDAKNRHSAM